MLNLGIMVSDLSFGQSNYFLIQNANEYVSKNHCQITVFYENVSLPCTQPFFATMQVHEIYGFRGDLITTNLNTTVKALKSFGPRNVWFYIWDLEWLRMKGKRYLDLVSIYHHPRVNLICRSEEHARVVEHAWNVKPKAIIENWNYEQIYQMVK